MQTWRTGPYTCACAPPAHAIGIARCVYSAHSRQRTAAAIVPRGSAPPTAGPAAKHTGPKKDEDR
ncbi:hypothetical protein ACGFI9_21805 [Micromonospora sp. NPDC048930]|uniref:hypothetical protein n=1 Tax=Micromonospora sp. NPDC048930 TaxID=3364261 RepID=UPI003722EC71